MVRCLALSLVLIFTFFSSTAMAGETIVNLWQSDRQLFAVPQSIAVNNSDGSVWVADYGTGEVVHLASDRTTVLATVSGFAFGHPQASAIAVNPSNGSAWVADMQNDRVLNISSSGTILRTITFVDYPSSVAVNTSDNSVWIADRGNNRVLNVSSSGTVLADIGGFYVPIAIAYDQTRNLCWVTSRTNATHPETLNRLSWNGSSWVKTTSSIIGSDSLGICVNPSNGQVWVADTYSRNVVRLDSSGAQLSVATLPYNPMKVAVNTSSGEAWVAYYSTVDYVTRFDSSGAVVGNIYGFDAAESIAVNQSNGDVWVADTDNSQIAQLDSAGIEEWRSPLSVREPRAISANPLDGSAWVADVGLQRIIQLGSTGAVLNQADARTYLTYSTISVAVDGGDGSVWHNDFILTTGKYYLKHIASDGSPLHTLDLGGNPTDFIVVNSGNGDCWRINGSWLFGYTNLAVNKANRYVGIPIKSASTNYADGTIWVAAYDAANGGHVIHYPTDGNGGALWDGAGFTEPSCVSVYSADGSVWVTQPSTNEVIHLAVDGSELWRGAGFGGPSLAAVDQSDGSVWVAGSNAKILYHLAASGAVLSSATYTLAGTITALSVDNNNGSVWLASDQEVAHYMANSSPTALDDTLNTYAYVPANGVLGATDPEADPLTFSLVSNGTNGNASITDTATGDFTYTPNAGYSGTDSFEFRVFDGLNYSNTATITVNILANNPPHAAADNVTVLENSSVNIPILANDSDPDGDAITLLSITQPAHGQNVLEADDTVTYTPTPGYSGADAFTYTILDSHGASATGNVSITVTSLPHPPTAVNDSATTYEDVPLPISVLANDTDPDGDTLSITSVTAPANGTTVINGTIVTYTPNADFSGADSFTYTITDGTATASATVSVNVVEVSDTLMDVSEDWRNSGTPLGQPREVATYRADGTVWVAVYGNPSYVVHMAADGSQIWRGTISGLPYILTLDVNQNDGSVWVGAGGGGGYYVVHLASDGSELHRVSGYGSITAISVNPNDGSVWVSDYSSNRVTHLSASGTELWRGTFNGPYDVSVNPNDGSCWVADTYNDRVVRLSPSGGVIWEGYDFNNPHSLAVNTTNGTVWVGDDGNSRVVHLSPYGGILHIVGGLTFPWDVSVNPYSGSCWVADRSGFISRINSSGVEVFRATDFSQPWSVSVNPSDDSCWVANYGDKEVVRLSSSGSQLLRNNLPRFKYPYFVSVNPSDGSCVVSDNQGHQVVKLAADGSEVWQKGGMRYPRHVSVNPADGTIWVADANHDQIVRLNADGTEMWRRGGFNRPESVSVNLSDGTCWVADTSNNQVVRLAPDGTEIWRHSGFNRPYSISANSSDGTCWVADTSNSQVVHLAADGAVLWRGSGFSQPYGVSVNRTDGSCWVADSANNQIAHIAADGTELWRGGGFNFPMGVSVNPSDGSCWVADTSSNQVVHLSAGGTELWRGNGFDRPYSVSVNLSDNSCWVADTYNAQVVHLTLTLPNRAPTATGEPIFTDEDTATSGTLSASDPDGDPLLYSIVSNGTLGTATITNMFTGAFTYTPNLNANGNDTFTFKVNDGEYDSNVATVTVSIAAINDPPVAVNDSYTTDEDTTLTIVAPGPLGNDSDPDGDTLSITQCPDPPNALSFGVNADGWFSYVPQPDFNGVETVTYTVSDNNGGTATATLTITVNPVNDPPVATDDTYTMADWDVLTVPAPGVLGNDSDLDGDTLTARLRIDSQFGMLTYLDTSGAFEFGSRDPRTYTFTYRVSDGNGGVAEATVTIIATRVNRAPTASDAALVTDEDTALSSTLAAVDPNHDALTYSIVTQPALGAVTLDTSTGAFTYTPNANVHGSDSFTFKANDGEMDSNTATVTITITTVNDLPVAVDDSVTTNEDTSVNIAVLANDTDVEDPLSVIQISLPAHGSVALVADTSVTYTPAANYNGTDSFTYTVVDSDGANATATVNITIAPVNDPPVAGDDIVTTPEDTPILIRILDNDTDVDGDTLSMDRLWVRAGAMGSMGNNHDGTLTYYPPADWSGTTNWGYYDVSDGNGGTDRAELIITVTPVNDAPVAVDDSALTNEDTSVVIDVLANDTDVDDSVLSVSLATSPANGTLKLNVDNTFTYTPKGNFFGADSFTYKVRDVAGASAVGTVNITIVPVDDPPAAKTDTATTLEDTPVVIAVLANDYDLDGDPLSVVSITQPAHGTATLNVDDTVTYTPAQDYFGSDSFTYTMTDGHTTRATSVQITITPVDDPVVAGDDTATTDEDTPVAIAVLANDYDVDGGVLSVSVTTNAANGTLVVNTNKTIGYTPKANFNGTDSFTYTATSSLGDSATATVNITVAAVNDPPVAKDDKPTTDEDIPVTFSVLANDYDVEGDALYITGFTPPAHGTVQLNADDTLTYTPEPNWNGIISFPYYVRDSNNAKVTATVFINIQAVNDQVDLIRTLWEGDSFLRPVSVSANTADGSCWVAENDGDSVAHLTSSGSLAWRGNNFYNAAAVSVNSSDGSCWVADTDIYSHGRVMHLRVNGQFLWGSTGFNYPESVSVNSKDNSVWIADTKNNRVFHLAADGSLLARITGFTGPTSVSVDKLSGHCWVADTGANRIALLSGSTHTVLREVTNLKAPRSVSVKEGTLSVWVADTGNNRVLNIDRYGVIVCERSSLSAPRSVSVNQNDGSVWVADTSHNRVLHLRSDGVELWHMDGFSIPFSVSVNSTDGSCWVADTGNDRVAHIGANHRPDAIDYTLTINEDTPVNNILRATDPDGDTLIYEIIAQGSLGNAVLAVPGERNFTYTPHPNVSGQDSFAFRVTDPYNASDVGRFTINILPVEDPPVTKTDSADTPEDTAVTIAVLDNDYDPEGGALSLTGVTQPANGSASINADGTATYTPNLNYHGSDTFTYTATDTAGLTSTASVNVTVNSVNDPPTVTNVRLYTNEDTPFSILLENYGSDADGDTLTFSIITAPSKGTAVISNPGTGPVLTYTPNANATGEDPFTYKANDGQVDSSPGTFIADIIAINDAPVAVNDSAVTDEDTAVVISVLANDTDADGDALTVSTQAGYFVPPTSGQATVNGDGTITYTPNANFAGSDSFQYSVIDPSGARSGMATVSITVNPVNDPPAALDDSASTNEDTPVVIDVLVNDTDVELDILSVSGVTSPAHGTATVNVDGTVTYTPWTDYNGTDTFTYTADDGQGASATATVTVSIAPVNDAPVPADDSASTNEDTPVTIDLLANDSDVDGDSLSVILVGQPAHGSTVLVLDSSVTYTPADDYNGTDSFTYTITDGNGANATGTVNITVNPVNDPPTAGDDTIVTAEDTAVTISVLLNDSDVDSPSLSTSQVTQPAYGSAAINPDNTVTYAPAANYNGTDAFTYTVSDGDGGSATATVSITITPVNDPPVAVEEIITTPEDTPILIRILDNDTDVDGDTLTFDGLLVRAGAAGTMGNNGDGTLTYYPQANWNGVDDWGFYRVSDGNGGTDMAALIITVTPVNDTPTAGDDSLTLAEDTSSTMSAAWLLSNDSDLDGDVLFITQITQPANGTATLNADNSITYTPAPDYFGLDGFYYTVSDGNGGTATATINIMVMPFQDAPVAVDDTAATTEDTAVIIYVLDNDYDVDGQSLSIMATTLGQPAHGTVVRTTPTYLTYTPDPNYHGPDSFTYMVSDGHAGTDQATVSVTVTSVPDPPVLSPIGDKSIDEGMELTFTLQADDPDGDTLTYTATQALPDGASLDSTTGVFVWLPDFLQAGNYTIEFEVSDGVLTDSETINIEVVDVNRPPVADANGPYTMEVGDSIQLDGSGSYDLDAPLDSIVTYDWDMNLDGVYDKTTSDAVCVIFWADLHAWRSGNIAIGQPFDILLRVTDSNGATDTATTTVTVQNTAPVADANGPYSTVFDSGITLDASGSVEPDTQCGDAIQAYKWDIDNDGTYEFTDSVPTRTLSWAEIESLVCGGTVILEQPYTIMLQVTDNNGAADTASTTLTIVNTAPVAAFTYTPTDPTTNDTIPFADASSDVDGTVTTWDWDFGDTATSMDQNPSHQYTAPGTYTVTLTVTDSSGATDVTSYDITVAPGGNTLPGSNVSLDLGDGVSVTFSEVTSAGDTTVTTTTTPPFGPPDGFKFLGVYYDISTTAGYIPPVTIAIAYNDTEVPGGEDREAQLKVFHSDGSGGWTDVTQSVDTVNNIIYAEVSSFSWFAIGWPTYDWLGFQPPVAGANRPFKRGSTIPFKFRIAKDGQPVPDASATIHIYYLQDGAPDIEPAIVSTAAGDLGSVFRYSPNDDIYIFNLSTKDPSYLDYFTYRAEAWLDDGTKYSINFSLK